MQATNPQLPANDDIAVKRQIVRQSLDEIAEKVGERLAQTNLNRSVFLTAPNSGDSVVMVATPLDPSDEDWSRAVEIVCEIVSALLDGMKLKSRELIYATARSTMCAADVTAE
jgi:hypothetical protein